MNTKRFLAVLAVAAAVITGTVSGSHAGEFRASPPHAAAGSAATTTGVAATPLDSAWD